MFSEMWRSCTGARCRDETSIGTSVSPQSAVIQRQQATKQTQAAKQAPQHTQRTDTDGEGQKRGGQWYAVHAHAAPPSPPACAPPQQQAPTPPRPPPRASRHRHRRQAPGRDTHKHFSLAPARSRTIPASNKASASSKASATTHSEQKQT